MGAAAALSKQRQKSTCDTSCRLGIERAKLSDEACAVEGPHLVQRDLPLAAVKDAVDSVWEALAGPGHGRHDHRAHRIVHFVGRNDEARARLADLRPDGGIERREVHAEALDYHV